MFIFSSTSFYWNKALLNALVSTLAVDHATGLGPDLELLHLMVHFKRMWARQICNEYDKGKFEQVQDIEYCYLIMTSFLLPWHSQFNKNVSSKLSLRAVLPVKTEMVICILSVLYRDLTGLCFCNGCGSSLFSTN